MAMKRLVRSILLVVALVAAPVLLPGAGRAAITTTTTQVQYSGNGTTRTFAVPFRFLESNQLEVKSISSGGAETLLVLGSGYTVAGAGGATGSVTCTTAPASGTTLRIRRVVSLLQPTGFRAAGAFSAKAMEDGLDRVAMQAQQLDRDRADVAASVTTEQAARATGDASVTSWAADQIAMARGQNPYQATSDSSTVLASGSTTARTLAARAAEVFNVKNFGCVGDDSHDDTACLTAAKDALLAAGGGVYYLPYGTYRTSTGVDFATSNGNARIRVDGNRSTIKNTSTAQIKAVLQFSTSSPQYHAEINDLFLDGGAPSKAYNGFINQAPTGSWGQTVKLTRLHAYNAHIGIDLRASMTSTLDQSEVRFCDIGVRLWADPTGGGANANQIRQLNSYINKVGVLVYASNDQYPVENNAFDSMTIQGATQAGVLFIGGVIHGQTIRSTHFENSITVGSAQVVDVGSFGAVQNLTITAADVVTYSAEVTVEKSGVGHLFSGRHSDLESGRSTLSGTFRSVSGWFGGNTPPQVNLHSLATTDLAVDRSSFTADGFSGNVSYFYWSLIAQRSPPGPRTKHSRNRIDRDRWLNHSLATTTVQYDPEKGRIWHTVHAASVGTFYSNELFFHDGGAETHPAGGMAYVSLWLRSTTAGSVYLMWGGDAEAAGGGAQGHLTLPLANVWYFIRFTGRLPRVATASSMGLAIYPLDTTGPTIDVAAPTVLYSEPVSSGQYAAWNSGTTYAIRQACSKGGVDFQSLTAGNLNHDPATDTTNWSAVGDHYMAAAMFNANAAPANLTATATWDPASIASGAGLSSSGITVQGARLGDTVRAIPPYDLQGLVAVGYVSAANTVVVRLSNLTGGAVDLATGTWRVTVIPQDEP